MNGIIIQQSHYVICYARTTGGKAGKGKNIGSTILLIDKRTNIIKKQFRFEKYSAESEAIAIRKAKLYLRELLREEE